MAEPTSPKAHALHVEGLSAGYGYAPVISGIDIEVAAGESVALIGANGAGKTTLLRSVVGHAQITAGRILRDGEDIASLPTHERVMRGLTLVPEGRQLFPGLSVQENLLMGAFSVRDKQITAQRLDNVYELFPILKERGRQLAGFLSGGEQQMCAVGRALMAGPSLLLIDEMSLGLAPVIVEQLADAIAQLREGGLSLLIVEQDVGYALELSDRAYVIEHGRTVLQGPSSELGDNRAVQEAYLSV